VHGDRQLFESLMPGGCGDSHCRSRADHATLKLGDFGECLLDAVLDGPDLGGNLIGGGFNNLLAHGVLLPSAQATRAGFLISKWRE
jgi:hypothetical protein